MIPILSKWISYHFLIASLEQKNRGQSSQNSPATWITYFSLSFMCSFLGSSLYYVLWCKKSYVVCTTFLLLSTSCSFCSLEKIKFEYSFPFDLLLHYWFFINMQLSSEWDFAFLSTSMITFGLIFIKYGYYMPKLIIFSSWQLSINLFWTSRTILQCVMRQSRENNFNISFPENISFLVTKFY